MRDWHEEDARIRTCWLQVEKFFEGHVPPNERNFWCFRWSKATKEDSFSSHRIGGLKRVKPLRSEIYGGLWYFQSFLWALRWGQVMLTED